MLKEELESITDRQPDMVAYPEEALLIGAAESVWNGSDAQIDIGIDVGGKLVAAMSDHLSDTLESVFIIDSDIRHIKRKHSTSEEERGQVAIEPSDFGRIPTVLNEFDTCEYTETDKLGNKKLLLTKSMGDTMCLVTVQRGKRKLEIKTMRKKRLGASC